VTNNKSLITLTPRSVADGADPTVPDPAVGSDHYTDDQGDGGEIPRGSGDEEQGDDGQAVHAHEGCFMPSPSLSQIHSNRHPESSGSGPRRRPALHARADLYVPEAVSGSGAHPHPDSCSHIYPDEPEHDERRHEADQENQVSCFTWL